MALSKQKIAQLGVDVLRGAIAVVRLGQSHQLSNDEAVGLLDGDEFVDASDAEKFAALRLLTARRRQSANS